MSVGIFIVLLILATGFSFLKRKLTITAIVVANLLAILIFLATGLSGVALLGTFFILGITVTSWNRKKTGTTYREDEQIEGKIEGQQIVILTKYVRKQA